MGDDRLGRREFLRLAAGAACVATVGSACSSDSGGGAGATATTKSATSGAGPKQLRIAQVAHFVPGYDAWFDNEYTRAWGERNGVQVIVDHIPVGEIPARAATEVASRKGHDLFALQTAPAAFEDDVLDLRDVVEQIVAKVGKATPLTERCAFNPTTNKWFGLPDHWSPELVNYRTDVWAGLGKGARPDSWADLLAAGPKLKAGGHPFGVDMSQDLDGNTNLMALLLAFGAALQTEDGRPALNSPATVQAVKAAMQLFSGGQAAETLTWNDAAANNRFLAGGKASLILNPISGLRAVEKQDPALARTIALAPTLAGPATRLSPPGNLSVYVIWSFADQPELAKQFLVDLVLGYREAFVRSEFYNLPGFPGSVPDLADLVANAPGVEPAGKYNVVANALDWSTNYGHPGPTSAPIDEIFNESIIPKMFATAIRREMTPEEAVQAADAQIEPIFGKWKERGKI